MRRCALCLLTISLLCGCSGNPPKNRARRVFPSTLAMSKWTNFEGTYRLERVADPVHIYTHKAVINEAWVGTNATVTIRQGGSSNIVVIYETHDLGFLDTNVITVATTADSWGWIWNNGVAEYLDRYQGRSAVYPGTAYGEQFCAISKNDDSSLTVVSSRRSGGRLFWIKNWSKPLNKSVLRLIPLPPEEGLDVRGDMRKSDDKGAISK